MRSEKDNECKMFTMMRGDKPIAYAYGPEWMAMKLLVDGGYKTPEEAKKAWEEMYGD